MMPPLLIGFLAAQFDDAYQNAVWTGAVEEAASLGATLVFYVTAGSGGFAFDLALRNSLSGLIVMTNSMGTSLSRRAVADYLSRFSGIPLVSIGIDFPGIPGVCAENTGCVRTLTEHLVNTHGRRKFLFLAGSPGHQEGLAREAECISTLSALLPDADPPVVYACDFLEEKAYERVTKLISSGFSYDAVVAANDQMALGAIRALEEYGINVPADVSVTGYDNTEDSYYSIPALTTIRQPMGELGARAVRYVLAKLDMINGQSAAGPLRSSCVMRNSCGCRSRLSTDEYALLPGGGRGRGSVRERLTEQRLRYQLAQRVRTEARFSALRDFESGMTVSLGMEELLLSFADGIRKQNIEFCALVLFDSGVRVSEGGRLMMISDSKGIRILAPNGICFAVRDILPGGLPPELVTFVCEPLVFASDVFGYLVCSTDSRDRYLYAVLRDQVSAALKRTMLLEEERNREKALETEVQNRTLELSLSNRKLTEEIARRAELERELIDISNNIMTRIGQDIHDDLCQDMAGISLLGEMLYSTLRREGHPQAELATTITETASETAKHAKQIARELYPAEFASNGILSAVRQLVSSRQGIAGARIRLEIQEGFFVHNSEKALQLYRIIQEALGNALRHSGASEIRVTLSMNREVIEVVVSDNGSGFKTRPSVPKSRGDRCSSVSGSSAPSGMGLKIMKYRANVIGGSIGITSNERGTVVRCRVSR